MFKMYMWRIPFQSCMCNCTCQNNEQSRTVHKSGVLPVQACRRPQSFLRKLQRLSRRTGVNAHSTRPCITSLHFSSSTSRSRNICLRVNIGSWRLRCIPMLKAIPISTAMSLNILREIVRVGALTRDCSTDCLANGALHV